MNIRDNIKDLLNPFQKGYYYNRAMGGSFSIKSVLPAIFPDDPNLDYHNLEGVHNGSEAMTLFPKIKDMPEEEQREARRNLLKYCELDTYAMVKVWEELVRVGGEGMSGRWTYDELVKGFWDGKDKNGNRLKLNNDGIREALRMALKDFTPRTEKKSEKAPEKYGVDEMLVDLGVLVAKYVEFFDESEKTKQEFEEWHEEQCKEFMDCIGEKFERLAYGKAQKIINMTFKYTFCLDGAKEKQEYFKYCHMPLDSLTLEWFWRAGNLKKYEEKMILDHV